jgi:hypothetical protein
VRAGPDVVDPPVPGCRTGVDAVSGVSVGYGAFAPGDRIRPTSQLH